MLPDVSLHLGRGDTGPALQSAHLRGGRFEDARMLVGPAFAAWIIDGIRPPKGGLGWAQQPYCATGTGIG